jgi:hypothetical protein
MRVEVHRDIEEDIGLSIVGANAFPFQIHKA